MRGPINRGPVVVPRGPGYPGRGFYRRPGYPGYYPYPYVYPYPYTDPYMDPGYPLDGQGYPPTDDPNYAYPPCDTWQFLTWYEPQQEQVLVNWDPYLGGYYYDDPANGHIFIKSAPDFCGN